VSGEDEQTVPLAPRATLERRHLRAALGLLAAARRDPHARRHLRNIVSLAGEGDPNARKALKTLAAAHNLQTQGRQTKAIALHPTAGSAAPRGAFKPLGPPAPQKVASAAPATSLPPSREPPWWDLLATWRRGMG
jgi:hypothetical protein